MSILDVENSFSMRTMTFWSRFTGTNTNNLLEGLVCPTGNAINAFTVHFT